MQHFRYPNEPKRLAALMHLTDIISSVQPIAGKHDFDLTDKVYRGKYVFAETNLSLPEVAIMENLDPDRFPNFAGNDDGMSYGESKENWYLLVQGWVKDDKKNPTDPAYRLMAAVRMALATIDSDKARPNPMTGAPGNPDYMLGGLIHSFDMEPGVARPPPEQQSKAAYFWMRLRLGITDSADPYDHDITPQ